MRSSRVGHSFRPYVKAASESVRDDLPNSPNPFTFVETFIKDVVLLDVFLSPVAFAVVDTILAPDNELSHPVSSFARHFSLAKGEQELHHVLSRNRGLQKIARPFAAGKA